MPFAHVNGVDLHYLQEGEGDDVLLLCGLGDDVSAWDLQRSVFAERFRVTVVDNRGVGRSSLPDGDFGVRDMAADAIALCDEVGISSAHVMGFSMGGAIAQELAIARPDLVRSLVIVGSWAFSDALFNNFMESAIYFSGLADDEERFLRYFLGSTYSHAVWDDGRIDEFARGFLEHPYPQELEAFQRTTRAIMAHDTRDRLPAIAAPTLVVYGEEDIICPPRHSRQIASLIPGARLVGVPEQAHQPFQEDPAAFNELVLAFIAGD